MANENKKYYWLKLHKDFFKRHDIKIIEGMPNGKDYVLFYLKLLVESIDHEGDLRFNETIPYDENMLATITNTNVDVVRSAVKIFRKLGLMEMLDDFTIHMVETKRMLGESSTQRVQRFREKQKALALKGNANETLQETLHVTEIEKEIELDIDKDLNTIVGQSADHVAEIIDYLNEKVGTKYSAKSKSNQRFINGRLNDGYTVDDLKRVIDIMCDEWLNTEMAKYLRPETLFNATKFQSYINRKTDKIYGDEVQPTNLVG